MRTNALLFASFLGLIAGDASAARIYVTANGPQIIGSGACSLPEAIYSSILHDTLDGMHGIAIDATDQGNPPDHFISTGCEIGDGNDTIVLPTKGLLQMNSYLDGDAYNPVGPTATPVIFSTITIEGNGAQLEWTGDGDARLFAVIGDSVKANGGDVVRTPNGTASGVGNLTLRNVYVKGFHVRGGDGVCGGGGGMGAGGAIYVWASYLTVENSTFDGNKAVGGRGLSRVGIGDTQCAGFPNFGGGGGIFGNGGGGDDGGGGAGGGGSKGDGGQAAPSDGGGGGGGTVFGGGNPNGSVGGASGFFCGGNGGDAGFSGSDGHEGRCPGGGGGGGGYSSNSTVACGANGGDGNYGGGGGGGDPTIDGFCHGDGGRGGFGGGGGAAAGNGGGGGFGGGGAIGIDSGGKGGYFGASAIVDNDDGILIAGGGAALGGAIFNDGGVVTIRNSTFTNNVANQVGESADGVGAAIFSHDGTLTVENSTISGNCAGNVCQDTGGAVVVFGEHSAAFTMNNTIIANNSPTIGPSAGRDTGECYVQGNVTQTGAGNLIVDNGPPTRNAARPNTTEGGAMAGCTTLGVVSSANPELGPLQDNGGYTKTMAIPFGSVAMGSADMSTSLLTDQRNVARPQAGGYDIGAFEVCRIKVGAIFQPWPCSEVAAQEPPIALTILASQGGTTSPATGSYLEPPNSVVPVSATPDAGYYFKRWEGNVVSPTKAATTIIMNAAQVIAADFQEHDFTLSLAPDTISLPIGGVGSSAVTAFAFGDFADNVTLSMSGVPTGISKSLSSNPVAPTAQTSVSSILTLTAGASAKPQTFTVTVTGNSTGLSGALTRTATLNAALVATAAAIVNVIGQEQALGCIDQSGIGQSLSAKMNAYQNLASGGHVQGAVNVLSAFQYEVLGQIGHHIVTSCIDSVTGTAFSPGDTLIADAQSLQATLATPVKGAPIVGSVVSTNDAGAAGRTVNLLSGKSVVATAITDAVGFYYLDTTALKVGAQYGVSVTIPKGYKASSPASQTFTWTGKPLQLATFTLN